MLDRLRRAWPELLVGIAALLFGAASLTYPFGRDQGLYYYVAREWVMRGAIPYRDVLDHKPPFIYVIYAIGVRVFGEFMWGIRVLDLIAIALIGVVAAELTVRRDEDVRRGTRVVAWLAAAVLYYGYLNYWDTAQSEHWYGLFGLSAIASARRIERPRRAALFAGAFCGAALLTKPPSVWFCLIATGFVAARFVASETALAPRLRAAVVGLAVFAGGVGLVVGPLLGYFAITRALPAMFDIVVGANSYYVQHERGPRTFADISAAVRAYHLRYTPILPLLIGFTWVQIIRSWRKPAFGRYLLALGILLGAYLAVAMQGKFYPLHWTVAVPAMAVLAANAYRTLFDALASRGRPWAAIPVYVAALGLLYAASTAPRGEITGPTMWQSATRHAYLWTFGHESRQAFTDTFALAAVDYRFTDSEQVGAFIRSRTGPDDLLLVRGFEPEIYAVARRRHSGRFFWATFLTAPERAYRREEWLKEDFDAIQANPPRFVVALAEIHHGIDAPEFFFRLGYRQVMTIGKLAILERMPLPPAPALR